jgi:uncharacterized protein YggT (Ycf19 family)
LALLLIIVQTLILVPMLALLAQFAVGLFNWHARHDNPVFQMLGIIARPALRAVRRLSPTVLSDRHVPWLTFWVLAVAYLFVGWAHRSICQADLMQRSCERWATALTAAP